MHKKKNRGTRRQQRCRAKQKLLFLQLSEITAACEQAVANDITKADEKMDEIITKLHVIQDAATEIRRPPSMMIMKRKAEAEEAVAVATARKAGQLMTTTTTTTSTAADQVIQSFSQLSIVPAAAAASVVSYPKQKKLRVSKYRLGKQQQQQKTRHAALLLPDYLKVPNRIFKHMIVAASEHLLTTDQNKIIRCWLNNSINMQYIRTYARLLDKLLYLQLKEALWTDYFNIGTAAEDGSSSGCVWASEVQEKISRQAVMNDSNLNNNNNNDDPLSFVINYRRYIDEQLQKTENELNEYLNRFKHRIDGDSSKSQLQAIDFSAILKAFVRKGQHQLNAEFQSKKRLLHFDYLDHHLTKAFFDLKPTKQQIHSAKKIWSATFKQQIAEEQVSILKHRLFCKTLPKTFDNILDHRLLDDLKKNLRPNCANNLYSTVFR